MKKKTISTIVSMIIILGGYAYQKGYLGSTNEVHTSQTKVETLATSQTHTSSETSESNEVTSNSETSESNEVASNIDTNEYKEIAAKNFTSGSLAYETINQNKSTLNANDWQQEKIEYGNLDQLNRTTEVTAYLSKKNLGKSETRSEQIFKPTGWHNQPRIVAGNRIFPQNRGHLIAYTLSFNIDSNGNYRQGELGSLDNPKNLATQSEFSNQKTMQVFEGKVRNALSQGKNVIYKVTTVFRDNELMCRGYWAQAVSTDGTLNFNVYIWNVEPGISFDYATGMSKVDDTINVQNVYVGREYNKTYKSYKK
ncbi:DNA/RNA non-specific endonuclease [Vagococcus entomophilus]|nr:DNA/RNA non-specific endonuclease [Vagococcus entomophilus]